MNSEQIREGYAYRRSDAGDYEPRPRFTAADFRRDRDHLRLLSIFYYVLAGLVAFFGSIPVFHVVMGVMMVSGAMGAPPSGPPPALGFVFIGLGSGIITFSWTLATLAVIAGRSLSTYRRRVFCLVVAGVVCLNGVLGTILGVFTILVLMRESVKELFERGGAEFETGAEDE